MDDFTLRHHLREAADGHRTSIIELGVEFYRLLTSIEASLAVIASPPPVGQRETAERDRALERKKR